MNEEKKTITAEAVAEHLTMTDSEAIEIAAAYLSLDVTSSNDPEEIAKEIEEAYQGKYANDEEFAQEIAEETGALDSDAVKSAMWPLYCIDWEFAARELMMDYSEQGGHYFRCV